MLTAKRGALDSMSFFQKDVQVKSLGSMALSLGGVDG